MSAPSPPHTRFGRYRVVRELGRGAMGVVYEAEDESLGRRVAVKTMVLTDDAEDRVEHEARFRQEGKAAGGLNHPGVITVYEMGLEGDWLYIVMELLEGVELKELMQRGTLTLAQRLDLIAQVASGLAAAHERGIIHRDVKPTNIMVLAGNRAKIMDFGIARMLKSEVKTRTGVMLGSPKYMSPEQVEGREIDYRSDLFSLGTVLYELVAGVAPFSGSDLGSLLFSIARAEPKPPSQHHPLVPPAVDRIVARALHRDPADRYQSGNDMARDLAACAASLAVPGSAASPPGADDDATVRALRPIAMGERSAAVSRPADEDLSEVTGGGGAANPLLAQGLRVSKQFDSGPALRRLEQLAIGAATLHPRRPTEESGRWVWPAVYAAATLAGAWIAFG